MNKTELQQVLDVLSSNRVMAKDAAGNYTREVTPKRITDAIALCEASQARAVEPVVRYEPERYDEDRVKMALDSDGDWVRYSDYLIAFATPQAAAQPPAPGEAAREYMTGYSDCKEWAAAPIPQQPAPSVPEGWKQAVALAYGHLWHVNNEPMAPIPLRSSETAAYEARKHLRDLLTREERGLAINQVQALLAAAPQSKEKK